MNWSRSFSPCSATRPGSAKQNSAVYSFGLRMDFATLQCTVHQLAHTERWKREPVLVLGEYPNSPLARMAQSKAVIHITDVAAEPGYIAREPRMVAMVESAGARTILIVPMLKEDELIGPSASIARMSAPSPTSRSRWCRTSPPRPSSPSRTRGCSMNCERIAAAADSHC